MLDLTSYYQRYSEPQSLPVMDGFFLIYVLILGCADQDTADWQDYRRRPPVILSLLRVSVLLRSIFSLSHSVCLSPALCRCVSRVPFRCCKLQLARNRFRHRTLAAMRRVILSGSVTQTHKPCVCNVCSSGTPFENYIALTTDKWQVAPPHC